MKSDFLIAITQLAAERNLPKELVLEAIETALASAYKKDTPTNQNIRVKISPTTGELKVYTQKTVVDAVTDEAKDIVLAQAQKLKADIKLGETIELESTPANAGRIAAQTAKQVVMQRLREAERDLVFAEFANKEGDVVNGTVQRFEGRNIVVDLGRTEAVMPAAEQVQTERYRAGQRMKFYLLEVSKSARGPQIVVSRTHKNFLKRLFEIEVPEIFNGIVEIKSIAREPGFRSKVAVIAKQEGVDAVGSCVGMRGIRIQNIVNELNGEKIDVVEWHRDPAIFIAKALAPAQVMNVGANQVDGNATVVVPDRQLSLAIGREGQNARLAAKLTGWRIDIKSTSQIEAEKAQGIVSIPPTPAQAPTSRPAAEAAMQTPVAQPAAAQANQPGAPAAPEAPAVKEGVPVGAETKKAPAAAEVTEVPVAQALASESTWSVQRVAPQKPQIRFAEDILAPSAASKEKGKAKKSKRGVPEAEDRGVKGKKAKKERIFEEDYGEDEAI